MRTIRAVYMRYKQTCLYGIIAVRCLRGIKLYRRKYTTSCMIALKSNFSLNRMAAMAALRLVS